LACYSAVRKFKDLLEGREFILYTDHKPLIYMFTKRHETATPWQLWHIEFLSELNLHIQHVSGAHNVTADTLSRISCGTISSNNVDYNKLARLQATDPELQRLITSNTSLDLKQITFSESTTKVYCDVSTQS